MQISQLKRPSAWNALLWKDFYQVRDIVLAIVLGVGAIQLVMLIVGLNLSQATARESTFMGIVVLGFVSPFLAALGCSGMLVGHERQVGTWNWSSALPISWRQSLASKFLVSFLVCIGVFLCLETAPLILVLTNHLTVPIITASTVSAVGSFMLFGILEVTCAYFLASLIFKDTLTGMVAATFGLGIAHSALMVITLASLKNNSPTMETTATWGVALAITGMAAVATAFVFRWRWYRGQRSTIGRFAPAVRSVRALPRSAREDVMQPTAWWSTLHLSLANNLGLRVFILLGYLVLSVVTFSPRLNQPSFFFSVIAVAMLGITTFAGDQALGRFRFLADRGVSPWGMATSRLCVAGALALLVVLIQAAVSRSQISQGPVLDSLLVASFVAIALVTFSVAALAALCFRQTVVAATISIVLVMGGVAATMGLLNLAIELFLRESVYDDEVLADFAWPAIYAGALSPAIAIAGIFWLIPKWIQRDDHKLSHHFWWIALLVLGSPVTLSLSTAFLRVPYVAWPELTLEQALAAYPPVPQAFEGNFQTQRFVPDDLTVPAAANLAEQEQFINGIVTEWDTTEVESLLSALELWLESPSMTQASRTRNTTRLGELTMQTALLAKFAVLEQKPELATRLLKAHRELQRLATQVALLETQKDRYSAIQILATFSADNVQALGGLQVFEDLLPVQVEEQSMLSLRTWADATIIRSRMRGEKQGLHENLFGQIPYIPIAPLRWYLERKLALSMKVEERYWVNQASTDAFAQLRNRIDSMRSQLDSANNP